MLAGSLLVAHLMMISGGLFLLVKYIIILFPRVWQTVLLQAAYISFTYG